MITKIVNVLKEIAKNLDETNSAENFSQLLEKNQKIDKQIVAAAYSWIHEKKLRDEIESNDELITSSTSLRIFSEEEKDAIGYENYNYLYHFYNIGLLTANDLEEIVAQLVLLDDIN